MKGYDKRCIVESHESGERARSGLIRLILLQSLQVEHNVDFDVPT